MDSLVLEDISIEEGKYKISPHEEILNYELELGRMNIILINPEFKPEKKQLKKAGLEKLKIVRTRG